MYFSPWDIKTYLTKLIEWERLRGDCPEVSYESEVAQSCPTLCDPMDCSLLGSSVCGILQARILEWAAISFSRRASQPRDQTWVSCIAEADALPSEPPGKLCKSEDEAERKYVMGEWLPEDESLIWTIWVFAHQSVLIKRKGSWHAFICQPSAFVKKNRWTEKLANSRYSGLAPTFICQRADVSEPFQQITP